MTTKNLNFNTLRLPFINIFLTWHSFLLVSSKPLKWYPYLPLPLPRN